MLNNRSIESFEAGGIDQVYIGLIARATLVLQRLSQWVAIL